MTLDHVSVAAVQSVNHLVYVTKDIPGGLYNVHTGWFFYRTQVNLGSDLWVRMSVTNYVTFVRLN